MVKLQLLLLWLLNLIDTLSTILAIRDGWAMEANPITDFFIGIDPIIFVVFKVSFVTICILMLWVFKGNRIVKRLTPWITIVYSVLVVWHIVLWGFVSFHGKEFIMQTIQEDEQCQME